MVFGLKKIIIILGTYMRPIPGEPEVLANTGRNQPTLLDIKTLPGTTRQTLQKVGGN